MKTEIIVTALSDWSESNQSVEKPSICPHCNIASDPRALSAFLVDVYEEADNKLYLLNYCSHCDSCFISFHEYNEDDGGYDFVYSAPQSKATKYFSDGLKELSPDFISVYLDSLTAEDMGLTSICGMGYRKALEFLIKDYSIKRFPNDEVQINRLPLSQCIEKYIVDDRLKALAKASVWIGNDETHYEKLHPTRNLKDLKIFINAFVTFIDSEIAYLDAESLVNPK